MSSAPPRLPNMDVYLYRYTCKRWWGNTSDVRYLHVQGAAGQQTRDLYDALRRDAGSVSGSHTCDVQLLQHLRVCFEIARNYQPRQLFPTPPPAPATAKSRPEEGGVDAQGATTLAT